MTPHIDEKKNKGAANIAPGRAVEGQSEMLQAVKAARVIETNDARWKKLRSIVEEVSLLRGDFTLSSGRKSQFLFQLRQTTLHPEGISLVGELLAEFMSNLEVDSAGGLELGAVPVVTAMASESHHLGRPVRVFFVRKQAKAHGAKELVNGYVEDGDSILAVDDVTTTGGSMMKAIRGVAQERGGEVRYAVSVVDREEGATEALAEQGIRLYSIFRKSDFAI